MDNIRKRHRRAHKISLFLISVVILLIPTFFLAEEKIDYAGSVSCKQCHERFYNLWSPSHHGKAMQPFTPEFAAENLTLQENDIAIGAFRYRAGYDDQSGWVIEKGPEEEKKYTIEHAIGGKNVYYFLTPLEKGKLQTLPLAYDVQKKEWFDMAASGVRHFADVEDEPFHWTDWPYTFNSRCYSCHVSQYSGNYDLKTDTYQTTWREPGINCETCHGPGEEHNRVFLEAEKTGNKPNDMKLVTITQSRGYTAHQVNASCSICHAKSVPITASFPPGEDFFEHYDLSTLEHRDFYPDGRDLGENYTYTTWRLSPCVKNSDLDCLHCHTSSGRYRFKGEETNQACMPCHEDRVNNAAAHIHHPSDSENNACVSCHMPTTEFARMRRSDHSMLPPTPAVTIQYKSPNACNICHRDQSAEWADKNVREWRERDYQKPVLQQTGLIHDARQRNWNRLPEMLGNITSKDRDEIFANSFIRLLRTCNDEQKWPALIKVLKDDPSPLMRSSAASALGDNLFEESLNALLEATKDKSRLVRIRAAASLAAVPPQMLSKQQQGSLDSAIREFEAALKVRPDDAASHYNLGNFYMDRRDFNLAIASYETAVKLRNDFILPLVNVSFAYNMIGQNEKAIRSLKRAVTIDPNSEAAHLNLGMLLGEIGKVKEAESSFRSALKVNPKSARAAYNLGVIISKDRIEESITWCRKAYQLESDEPKYAYTLAFYLIQKGEINEATDILQKAIELGPNSSDIYLLLGDLYERQGKFTQAQIVYTKAAENTKLSEKERLFFSTKVKNP